MFAASQVLPGDVGRNVLGGIRDQRTSTQFNQSRGLDRPLVMQYWDWFIEFLRGDLGTSLQYHVPVAACSAPALSNSLKLAAVAFVLLVRSRISAGRSGLRRGPATDRVITVTGPVR